MKNIYTKYKTALLGVAFLSLVSCNDLDLSPTSKFTENNYWTSLEKANLILNMAYNQMYNNNYFFSTEALSDNIYEGRGLSDEKRISSGQADAANGRFENEWRECYAGIKTCHTFLDNIDKLENVDEEKKENMKAEARFIRAYLFFRLTTWYGDVPLFFKDITLSESKTVTRTSQSDVLAFVRKELAEVAEILPAKEDYAQSDRGRATSGAAIALLARTYLYSNDWANVAATCEKLINTGNYGQYELFPSYEGLFLPENEYNNEVILDIQYVPVVRTWGNFFDFGPLSAGCRLNAFAPTQELVNDYVMLNGKAIGETGSGYNEADMYSNRDPRLTATIVYHGYSWKNPDNSTQTIYIQPGTDPDTEALNEYRGQGTNATSTGYYLRKYYDPTSITDMHSGLNLILVRYADVLLMYAEAKNELGQMDATVWNATIRAIRERAGFTDAAALEFNTSLDKESLRTIIRRERRCELAIEGLRIFDIRRWKTAEIVLNGNPHGAKFGEPGIDNGFIRLEARSFNSTRDYLWAIPQSQKDINPNLGQNPNY
ncbi:MAG: RagB/SusD family nutrient uptake outer membrane protein [Bacteroidales bacterium]|nr:RagB/SusD family nutrient uptake outer membrane protein [Bacteroidales bacterium]